MPRRRRTAVKNSAAESGVISILRLIAVNHWNARSLETSGLGLLVLNGLAARGRISGLETCLGQQRDRLLRGGCR